MCLVSVTTFAQVAKDTTWKRSDFIADTDEYLSIKLDAHNTSDRIQLVGQNALDIRPNTDVRNKLSVNYKWLTVGFSFRIPNMFGNGDNTKGETKTSGFNFGLNLDRWAVNFQYTKNVGHYLENSRQIDPMIEGNTYILFPDFTTFSYNFSVGYLTNTNFSLKSLTSLTERQLKSSGSFMPYARATYFKTQHPEDGLIDLDRTNNYQAQLGVSYTHKFVLLKNFYVATSGSLGYGAFWYKTINDDLNQTNSGTSGVFGYHYGASTGYNGDRFFVGAIFNHIQNNYPQQNEIDFSTVRNNFEIFIGYRIRVPKFLRKPLNFVDDTKQKIINKP